MVTTESISGGSAPPVEPNHVPSGWERPPGRLFHLALVPPALGLLWSHSVPGFAFSLWSGSTALLILGVVVWFVRLLAYAVARRRRRVGGRARWFLLAPAVGALTLVLIAADVPLRVRWSVSRSHFEAVVEEAMEDDDYSSVEIQRLGLYEVPHVYRQGEAIIFYERTGAIMDDAGFAYLPEGPFPEFENGGFERPEFRHLGGRWYAWTASW